LFVCHFIWFVAAFQFALIPRHRCSDCFLNCLQHNHHDHVFFSPAVFDNVAVSWTSDDAVIANVFGPSVPFFESCVADESICAAFCQPVFLFFNLFHPLFKVTVGQSDPSIPVPQELHSRERSSARTDSATSTEALAEQTTSSNKSSLFLVH